MAANCPADSPPSRTRPRRPAHTGGQPQKTEGRQGTADGFMPAPLPVESAGDLPVEVFPPSDQNRAQAEHPHLLGAVPSGQRPLQVPVQPLRRRLPTLQVELMHVVDHTGQGRRQRHKNDRHEQDRVPEPDDDTHRDHGQRPGEDAVDREEDVEEKTGGGGFLGAPQEVVEVGALEDLQAEGPGPDLELFEEPVLHLLLQPLQQDRPGPRPDAGLDQGHGRPQGQPREHGIDR